VVIIVLGWLWVRSLARSLVTADTTTQAAAVRGAGSREAALPFARSGLSGTIAARFWVYQRRDPSALIYWGIIAIVMVVATISSIRKGNAEASVLLAAGFGGAFVGVFHANAIGMTGPAFGLEALSLTGRRDWRAYFAGQDTAIAIVGVPLVTVIVFALAAVAGHPADGFIGAAAGFASAGAGLAVSNFFTAALAYPVEKRVGSPTPRGAEGFIGYQFLGTFGNLIGVGVLYVPMILAVVFTGSASAAVRMPVLLVCGAVYGTALAWAGTALAARVAERQIPELFQLAARSKL
jgi:ABC-2 type transport system permease protein